MAFQTPQQAPRGTPTHPPTMGPEFPHKLLLHTYACQGGKWAPLEPVQQLGGARPAPPPVRLKSLKVLTYNVCFECHRKDIREQELISLMFHADADFLCLQEVTPGFMKRLFQTRWVQEAYVASDGPRGRTVAQGKRGASLQYGCVILAKKHWRPSFTAWALPGRLCRHLITAQCCAMPERAVPGVVVGGHDLPEPEPGSATPCAAPAACLPSPAGDMLHEADRGTPSPPCRQPEVDPQDCLSLVIATSHLESGKGATKFREEQLVHIFGLLGLLSEDTTRSAAIFMGDFNFSDGWPEERLLSPAFRDVWLARHRAEDGLTMTSQGTYKDWRPDHILIRSPTPRGLPADPTEFLMEPKSIHIIGKDPLPLQPHEAPSGLDRFLTPSDHFGLVASLSLQRGIPMVNEVEEGEGEGEQVGGPLAPGFPSAGSSMTVEGASAVPPGTWDSARGPSAFSGASKAGATPSASGDTLPPLMRRASEHHLDFPASALEGCEGGVHSPMPGTGVCDAGHPTTPLLGAMKGTCPPSAACLTPAVPVPVHTPVAKPQQYTLDGGLIDISPPERARRPLALTAEAQRLQDVGDGPCSSSLALQRLDDASGSGGRGVDLNSTQPELRSRFQLTNSAAPASRLELGTPTPEVPSHRLLGKLVSPPTTHRASARCLDAGRSRLRSTGQGFGRLGAQAVLHGGHTSLTPAMQGLQLSQSSRSSPGRSVAERAGSVERKAARNGDDPHDDDLDVSGDTELLQVDGDDLGHLALQQHPQVSPSRVCGMGKGAPESDFAWAPAPRSEQGEGTDSMDVLGPLDGADLASRSLELPSSAQFETDLGLAVRTQGLDMGVAAASAPVSGHSVSSLYTPHFAADGGTPASFSPAVTPVATHEGAPYVRPQRHSASFRAEDSFQDLQQDSELASIPFVQHDSGASAHPPQRPSSARSTASFQSSLGGRRRGRSEARINETTQQQFFLASRTATLRPGPEMLRSGAQTPGARSQQAEVLSFDGSGQPLRRSKSQYALNGRERARTSTSVGMGGGFSDFRSADVSPELAHDFDASGASRPMVATDSSEPDAHPVSVTGDSYSHGSPFKHHRNLSRLDCGSSCSAQLCEPAYSAKPALIAGQSSLSGAAPAASRAVLAHPVAYHSRGGHTRTHSQATEEDLQLPAQPPAAPAPASAAGATRGGVLAQVNPNTVPSETGTSGCTPAKHRPRQGTA